MRNLIWTWLFACTFSCGSGTGEESESENGSESESETEKLNKVCPANWSTFGFDAAGGFSNPVECLLSVDNVARLETKWRFDGANVTSMPAVVDDTVYFGTWQAKLRAVDAQDGTLRWETSLPGSTVSDDSPTVTESLVFIGDASAGLHAVNRATGAIAWSVDLDPHPAAHTYSSPAVIEEEDLLVIGVASVELVANLDDYVFRGSVVGLRASTGDELWRVYVTEDNETSGAGVSVWSSAAIDKNRKLAFIGTGQAYEEPASPYSDSLLAIDYQTGTLVWHCQFTSGDVFTFFNHTGPDYDVGAIPNLFSLGTRDLVGVGDKGGFYYALDRDSGDVVWMRELGPGSTQGGVMAAGAVAGGVIYVANNITADDVSELFALAADDGDVLWQTMLSSTRFGPVTEANGVVYVGTSDGLLHAIDAADGHEVWSDVPGQPIGGGISIAGGKVFVPHGFVLFTAPGDDTGGLVAYGLPE